MGKAILYDETELKIPDMKFTDRESARDIFWDKYDALGKDEFYVINYHGYGGIGKSWLCKYLYDILRSRKHPLKGNKKISSKSSIIFNFEDLKYNCDKVSVLENLANKLESECGFRFSLFKYGVYVYYRSMGKNPDSPEIKCIQDNQIMATVLEILPYVPVVGSIGSSVLKCMDSLGAVWRDEVQKHKKKIKELDRLSSEDISNELVRIFAKELSDCTQKADSPVVIFLDTYEQLQNYVYQTLSAKVSEDWLWSGLIPYVPNVLWVLSGQRQVTWGRQDKDWENEENIKIYEINRINDEKLLKDMLEDIGIEETDIRDVIVEKTKGVPVHLALCKDIYFNLKREKKIPAATDFDMEYNKLAERFIGGLDSSLKWIVHTLACLESWNREDAESLGLTDNPYRYEYVMQLSFISSDNGIYNMHHEVRDIIYKDCLKEIKEKCLEYFDGKIKSISATDGERKDYIYKKMKLRLDMISADSNEKEIDDVIEECLDYILKYIYEYDFFVRMKRLLDDKIPDNCFKDSYKQKLNIYSLYHCVIGGDYQEAERIIERRNVKIGSRKLDTFTRRLLYVSLAVCEEHKKNYSAVKNNLWEAYDLFGESDDIYTLLDLLVGLARACFNLEEYPRALEYCDKGIEKIDEMKACGINPDTKSIASYISLLTLKSTLERQGRNPGTANRAIEYLKQAEEALRKFDDIENDGIYCEWTGIYQEYMKIYGIVARDDLQKEYALKALSAAQEAYESAPIDRNYRSLTALATAYLDMANVVLTEEETAWFDKAMEILPNLKEMLSNSAAYDSLLRFNRLAGESLTMDDRIDCLKKCGPLLVDDSENSTDWDVGYRFRKAELMNHYDNREYDNALEKLEQIEGMLETRKDRLPGQAYLLYKSWNCRMRGNLYKSLEKSYADIKTCYVQENSLRLKLYREYPNFSNKISYADSCSLLAVTCASEKFIPEAASYADKQIAVDKAFLEDFPGSGIMKRYITALEIIAEKYRQTYKTDEFLEKYDEVLKVTEGWTNDSNF